MGVLLGSVTQVIANHERFLSWHSKKFKPFFIFFVKFILDVPSSRIKYVAEKGLISEEDKMEFIPPEFSEEITLMTILERFKSQNEEKNRFIELIVESQEFRDFSVMKNYWWFKYNEVIDSVTTKKKMVGYLEWSKKKKLKVGEYTIPKKGEDWTQLRNVVKDVYNNNQKEIDEMFPDPR